MTNATHIVTGNTYPAHKMLKDLGMTWDPVRKGWLGEEWMAEKATRPSWAGRLANGLQMAPISEVKPAESNGDVSGVCPRCHTRCFGDCTASR